MSEVDALLDVALEALNGFAKEVLLLLGDVLQGVCCFLCAIRLHLG